MFARRIALGESDRDRPGGSMEKSILTISYWLGVLCTVLAVAMRVLNMLGVSFYEVMTRGNPIAFRTFLNGAMLFFLAAIASAAYSWHKSRT